MRNFQEMISFVGTLSCCCTSILRPPRKYQFMEANNQKRKASLDEKIPDLERSLDTVRFLQTRKVVISLAHAARARSLR